MGCASEPSADEDTQMVSVNIEPCSMNTSDPVSILSANVVGSSLELETQYGGGCQTHTFTACFATDSDMGHTTITLHHDANDDKCKALVSQTVEIILIDAPFTVSEVVAVNSPSVIVE